MRRANRSSTELQLAFRGLLNRRIYIPSVLIMEHVQWVQAMKTLKIREQGLIQRLAVNADEVFLFSLL